MLCKTCGEDNKLNDYLTYSGGFSEKCSRCRKRHRKRENRRKSRQGKVMCHYCDSNEGLKHVEGMGLSACVVCRQDLWMKRKAERKANHDAKHEIKVKVEWEIKT